MMFIQTTITLIFVNGVKLNDREGRRGVSVRSQQTDGPYSIHWAWGDAREGMESGMVVGDGRLNHDKQPNGA